MLFFLQYLLLNHKPIHRLNTLKIRHNKKNAGNLVFNKRYTTVERLSSAISSVLDFHMIFCFFSGKTRKIFIFISTGASYRTNCLKVKNRGTYSVGTHCQLLECVQFEAIFEPQSESSLNSTEFKLNSFPTLYFYFVQSNLKWRQNFLSHIMFVPRVRLSF